jgi:hypothetical protein
MRPQNHASRPKGIPKTKLQGSGPSGRKTLQSQITRYGKNRLVINALAVVHERLASLDGSLRHFHECQTNEISGKRDVISISSVNQIVLLSY